MKTNENTFYVCIHYMMMNLNYEGKKKVNFGCGGGGGMGNQDKYVSPRGILSKKVGIPLLYRT